MRFKLTIDVTYDDATVKDKIALGRALGAELNSFIDRGHLTPLGEEVTDEVECGVEEVHGS